MKLDWFIAAVTVVLFGAILVTSIAIWVHSCANDPLKPCAPVVHVLGHGAHYATDELCPDKRHDVGHFDGIVVHCVCKEAP